MKVAISFLKIGSEFQGIFSHALGLVDDISSNKNNKVSLIVDKDSYKKILSERFPNIPIFFIEKNSSTFFQKLSIFFYIFFKINFFKKIFCRDFIEIEKKKFDIIFHPNWSIFSFGLDTFSVASVHDTAFNNKIYEQSLIHKFKLKLLINIICKYSEVILCESKVGKNEIINFFSVNQNKIVTRYNLPNKNFRELSNKPKAPLDNFKELNNKKYLLLPSRWGQYKNQSRVILALDKYNKESREKLLLVLTGVGDEIEKINHFLKEKNISNNNICIFDSVSSEQLVILYQNAYALIFPSLLGPTSLPLFEALENNCPIITSNLEGHLEVLGTAAIYVDPMSEKSIFDSLKSLNENIIKDLKIKMEKRRAILINSHEKKEWLQNIYNLFDNFK